MTTTKRCEVCGKEKCSVWNEEHPVTVDDLLHFTVGLCHGHSSPPPRPDEIEKELEKLLGEGTDEMPGHHTDCSYRPDFKKKLKSLLLSYGKEREKEMWVKCREAVEKVPKTFVDTAEGHKWNQCRDKALSALDSVNPER